MKTFREKLHPPLVGLMLFGVAVGPVAGGTLDIPFNDTNFIAHQPINNDYWPLLNGSVFVYYADSEDGCAVNRLTVTGAKKSDFSAPYDNIVAWEVEDLEWLDEECTGNYLLMEETTDYYAQDKDKNIWYFGEETTAYDDEEFCPSDEGAWEAGGNSEAGIVMLGNPSAYIGDKYQQELDEDNAEDMGRVLKVNKKVTLDTDGGDWNGEYFSCLATKEWTPLAPGEIEHKYYCTAASSGAGLMAIDELSGGKTVRVELIGNSLPAGTFSPTGVCP